MSFPEFKKFSLKNNYGESTTIGHTSLLNKTTRTGEPRYTPPYRIGKKQRRAVLDALGKEVIVFKKGDEALAKLFCETINYQFLIKK